MKKICLTMVAVFTMAMMFVFNTYSADWVQDGINWKLIKDGAPVVNDWYFENMGANVGYYYFDENGNMVRGLKKIGEDYYLFDINGRASANDVVVIDENRQYKTKQKGKLQDTYSTTVIDVDAFNAKYLAELYMTDEQKAALAAERAAAEAEAAAAAQLEADMEKRGPKSGAAQEMKAKEVGPGMGM